MNWASIGWTLLYGLRYLLLLVAATLAVFFLVEYLFYVLIVGMLLMLFIVMPLAFGYQEYQQKRRK